MTSLGTKQVQSESAIYPSSPLLVRIPRKFTQFKLLPRLILPALPAVPGAPPGSGAVYINPRGKILNNLAKKISLKNRKLSNSLGAIRASTLPGASAASSSRADPSKGFPRVCPSCGHQNPQHKKRCCACNEFIVGTRCPACNTLNYYRSKTCSKCGIGMPGEQPLPQQPQRRSHDLQPHEQHRPHDQTVVPSSAGTSDSSSHPASPSSPKFSAPPIRSAVLKSLFPQVWGCPPLSVFLFHSSLFYSIPVFNSTVP